jgi:hypothetical protein
MTEGKEISYSIAMAVNILPPNPMVLTGDWNTNWDNFRDEFEDYALVTGLHEKPNEVQAATLRSLMGSECRHTKVILDALENYFKPARNVIYERFVFGSCKQEEGESVHNFVTHLREKSSTCLYGGLKDELIRDKIVLGIANEVTRRRLLRERGLTLVTAIEMCRTAEVTDIRM